jgi:hypothetical protein
MWAFLLFVMAAAGCSATGTQRILLDRYSAAAPGVSVANFSVDEVDSFVRYFASQRGYEIRFADSEDARVQRELPGEDASLLWLAEKPGSPAILFISSNDRLTVSFVQTPGTPLRGESREYSNVLYAILREKFGQECVRMGEPPR